MDRKKKHTFGLMQTCEPGIKKKHANEDKRFNLGTT